MFNPQPAEVLQTSAQPSALSTSHPLPVSTSPSAALIDSLVTASPLLVVCLTFGVCFYFSVQIMEQVNRFVELVRKK